jgi:uncharacterized protein
MMRLAEYLYRWTGDPVYADYWERNLWNGILAQQHPDTGMIAYFLPLHAGAVKAWGTPTEDFWCCHGSLVQAHTIYANHIAYTDDQGIVLAQWIPGEITWQVDGIPVTVRLEVDVQLQSAHRPKGDSYSIHLASDQPVNFCLRLRIPWWIAGKPEISVDGKIHLAEISPSGYLELKDTWKKNTVQVKLPRRLVSVPLPDDPQTIGLMDGPIVLAGLNPAQWETAGREKSGSAKEYHPNYVIAGLPLFGEAAHPEQFLTLDDEREWSYWRGDYRTVGQPTNFRLIPLYEVRDEVYTVYFEIKE